MDISNKVEQDLEIFKAFEVRGKNLILELLDQTGSKYHSVESRVKDPISLKRKIKKKQEEILDETQKEQIEITDLLGIRIITYYEDDVDSIAKILKDEFLVDEKNCIDKRHKKEDEFGYLSLHLVLSLNKRRGELLEYKRFGRLKFEVQIRSLLQHTWAAVSHELNYKNEKSVPEEIHRKLNRQASILEEVDDNFKAIRNMAKKYKETVDEQIETENLEVPINAISLERYLRKSKIVKDTLLEMLKIINPSINLSEENIYAPRSIDNCVEILDYANVKSLYQLNLLIENNYSKLPNVFEKWAAIADPKNLTSNLKYIKLDAFVFYLVLLKIVEDREIDGNVVESFYAGRLDLNENEKLEMIEKFKELKKQVIK